MQQFTEQAGTDVESDDQAGRERVTRTSPPRPPFQPGVHHASFVGRVGARGRRSERGRVAIMEEAGAGDSGCDTWTPGSGAGVHTDCPGSALEWREPVRVARPAGTPRFFFARHAVARIGDTLFRPVRCAAEGQVLLPLDDNQDEVTMPHESPELLFGRVHELVPTGRSGSEGSIPKSALERALSAEALCVETARICEGDGFRCEQAALTDHWPDILAFWRSVSAENVDPAGRATLSRHRLARWMQLFQRPGYDTRHLCSNWHARQVPPLPPQPEDADPR